MKICFATHNENKLSEIQKMVPDHIEVVGLKEIGVIEDIPETGNTLEENSKIKAQYLWDNFGMPVFADDTGLEVNALKGAPGVYSARYAGPERDNEANIDLLLKNLQNETDRSAAFKTVITFINQNGEVQQFTGIAKGQIIAQRTGSGGFGYDPVFVPEGYEHSFAEMSAQEKNKISHRGKAFALLMNHLKTTDE